MKKLFILFIAVAGFSGSSFALPPVDPTPMTAKATASIIVSISISKDDDMSFGKLNSDGTAGTAVLLPAGTIGSVTDGVTTVEGGLVKAANFTVKGSANTAYTIVLPPSASLTKANGEAMLLNTFVSTPVAGSNGLLTTLGSQTLSVGATLHVNADQAGGVYTSEDFTVTVAY